MTSPSRALVVGTGLIGGSIGMALRQRGWHVSGVDDNLDTARRAHTLGVVDELGVGPDFHADVAFVATPVSQVPSAVGRVSATADVITDVASVKAPIVRAVPAAHFIGGHPMAGSEQEGVEGADPALFEGATWVLTPTDATDPAAYARVHEVVSSLGADVVALPPDRHDELVAVVSHVPHLTAATLMRLAAEGAEEHAALLRLAAGGFRDMTRGAAGHPGIWPDICAENREAIVSVLDRLVAALSEMRDVVADADRARLLELLETARGARTNLPSRVAARPEELVELRVPVPDRPGVLAEVTTLAGEVSVNILDLEIAHSAEGDRGVLILVVDAKAADLLRGGLVERGFRPSVHPLA